VNVMYWKSLLKQIVFILAPWQGKAS
jgi:hypothetical protein